MKHLLSFASMSSALGRRVIVLVHLPVAAFLLIAHTARGCISATGRIAYDSVGLVMDHVEALTHNIIAGVRVVGNDMATVWRGPPVQQAVQADPVQQVTPVQQMELPLAQPAPVQQVQPLLQPLTAATAEQPAQ